MILVLGGDVVNESILITIKNMLMIPIDCNHFDPIVIVHINSIFSDLHQLGVGPSLGFVINDETACWNDYISDTKVLESVKSYIFLKIRLLFDPPTNATIVNAYKEQIKEYEWRLNVASEEVSEIND